MALIIRKPGISTTVQDLGRIGARRFGVNPGGVMDKAAARAINIILGNPESAAVLETHFPAFEIEFDADTVFAIGGADLEASVDGLPVRNWRTLSASKGTVLNFKQKHLGERAYIAVQGGLRGDDWLGSVSTNLIAGLGGYSGRKLAAGDRIECGDAQEFASSEVGYSLIPRYSKHPTVRVLAGSEFDLLTAPSERSFRKESFALTNDCNRMGYRLSGPALHLLQSREMVSSAVCFGTVQLLPDGQLILLMADHQTSGGYPRIASVISVDLPLLAQCGPHDQVRFEIVSIDEAEQLALQFEKELNFLRVGCRLQNKC